MSISISSNLNELYILRTGAKGALNLHSCKDKHAAIDHLVRDLMLDASTPEAKDKVRATVEKALRHMDPQCAADGCDAYLKPPQDRGYCSPDCERAAKQDDDCPFEMGYNR